MKGNWRVESWVVWLVHLLADEKAAVKAELNLNRKKG